MSVAKDLSTHDGLKEFLTHYGWLFDLTPEELGRRQLELVGAERFAAMGELHGRIDRRQTPQHELYTCFETVEEAHNLISLQSAEARTIGAELYAHLRPRLQANTRVCDLGCFTGGYLAWLAASHPDCQFVGFDRSQKAIDFARQLAHMENLSFEVWDYSLAETPSCEPFDMLYSIFGLQFDNSTMKSDLRHSLDLANLRASTLYEAYLDEAVPYFASWRRVATDAARLYLIARITSVEVYLAVIDAAHRAGWTMDLRGSANICSQEQIFAMMAFQVEPCQFDESAALEWWWNDGRDDSQQQCFGGEAAVRKFRSINDRTPTGFRDFTYADGHQIRVEVGKAGDRAYLLQRTTRGATSLQLISTKQLSKIRLNVLTPRQLPLRMN